MQKKSNLASPVPAGLLPLISESAFIFVSSFDIPTLKSWSVLSDPFIQTGGSWTLRNIWPFVPKWGGQREGKWEFAPHASRVSFNFVTIPHQINLELKWAKIICSENYNFVLKVRVCKVNISWKYPESWTRKKRAQDSETQSSVGLRQRCPENWTKNRAGLTGLHSPNFTKEHKSIIISLLRSYWYWISLALVFV